MSEVENAAIILRRKLSDRELAGKMTTGDAVRLSDALHEIESILEEK